ncbi:MAG: GC-type dockerin domain-anchored protein, partial [Phycisphaerales bacterium]
ILAPGVEVVVRVTVEVPFGFSATSEGFLVSARVDSDGGTRSYATIEARRRCLADIDRNEMLNVNDYLAFLNAFAAGSEDGDADANGQFDVNDFVTFVNAYAAGCS